MSNLYLVMHGQDEGEVNLTISSQSWLGTETLTIERENVPALLMTILNALKQGDYPPDVLQAAAMTCAAFLSPRLAVVR